MAIQRARGSSRGGREGDRSHPDLGPLASCGKGGLELRLLGPLEVRERASGKLLRLRNAKTRVLLAILACGRGRVFPQEELIERLWHEELSAGRTTPERARTNLRGRIAELRRLHPTLAETITTHPASEPGPGGYCLERSSLIQVDLEELTRHLGRGRALTQRGQLPQALPSLEEAARLWRGDFLQEESYAEWAAELRKIWRERHLEGLSRLAECYARLGRYRRAIERCRQILGLSPRREEGWRALMLYLYHAGREAEALEAYEECKRALAPLGMEPSPKTQRLAEQIRHHLVDRGPYPPPPSPDSLPYSLEELPTATSPGAEVGREERCYERLREARWGWGSGEPRPICPYCRGSRVHGHGRLPGSPERRYRCFECGATFTDRTGTVFAHRNLPLAKLFQALKLLAQADPPLEARELAGILEVDLKTAADLRRKLSVTLREKPWVRELAHRVQ